MTVPTLSHDEALSYARAKIAEFRDSKVPEDIVWGFTITGTWFDPETGHDLERKLLMRKLLSTEGQLEVTQWARAGYPAADEAVYAIWRELQNHGQPIPQLIGAYMIERESVRHLPGKRKSTTVLRDIAIASVIRDVRDRFSIPPTRNREGKEKTKRSGCRILHDAMHLETGSAPSERAIEKIWERWHGV